MGFYNQVLNIANNTIACGVFGAMIYGLVCSWACYRICLRTFGRTLLIMCCGFGGSAGTKGSSTACPSMTSMLKENGKRFIKRRRGNSYENVRCAYGFLQSGIKC